MGFVGKEKRRKCRIDRHFFKKDNNRRSQTISPRITAGDTSTRESSRVYGRQVLAGSGRSLCSRTQDCRREQKRTSDECDERCARERASSNEYVRGCRVQGTGGITSSKTKPRLIHIIYLVYIRVCVLTKNKFLVIFLR